MITFTPLAGSARSDSALPLAYILEIDDVKVLLDCGSPDWHPDDDIITGSEALAVRDEYCAQLQRSSVISTLHPFGLTITHSTSHS
jgi:cleavage and polyadenylation specificity factor subunit 2